MSIETFLRKFYNLSFKIGLMQCNWKQNFNKLEIVKHAFAKDSVERHFENAFSIRISRDFNHVNYL